MGAAVRCSPRLLPALEFLERRLVPARAADFDLAGASAPAAPAPRQEVVFVDARVPDAAALAADAAGRAEVHVLAPDRDGLRQIAAVLAGRHGLDDVHIVSHGAAGEVFLGDTVLSLDDLGEYGAGLAIIARALAPGSDLLLYGCDVAAGGVGGAFLDRLAAATGAVVAGSTDPTGAPALGGDWVLERATGPVDARPVFDAAALSRVHGLLGSSPGIPVAWGDDTVHQTDVPAGLGGVTAVAAGGFHGLALKADGTVVAWGYDVQGQTDVPPGLGGVVAVAAGDYHSLALKSDGTVVAWGDDTYGQVNVPAGLSGVVAISAHGYHNLALKADGTVVAWGDDRSGESDVPAGLSGVVAISAGSYHSLALKADGTVVAWGDDTYGQSQVPAGLSGVVAVAAGGYHSLALKSDGTVVAWGDDQFGQTDVPTGLSGVVAVAAGGYHSLALKSDGTVVAWGLGSSGQTTVPAGLSNVFAIGGGFFYSLALTAVSVPDSLVTAGSATLTVGGTTTVTLQLRDSAGHNLTHGGAIVSFALAADGTGGGTFGPVTDHGDGTFSATFTADTAGTADSIQATVNGQTITSTASLTVLPGTPTVQVAGPGGVYDGTAHGATSASVTGVNNVVLAIFGDPSLSYTYFQGGRALAGPPVHAGSYTVVAHYAGSRNYNPADSPPVAFSVTPVPLAVTANDASKVYGAPLPAFSARYAGFVNGDGPASLKGTLSFTTAASAASHVAGSPYVVTAAGLTSSDYTITFPPGQLTITPAPLAVTADDASKVYGAPLPAFSARTAGFVNGDTPLSLSGNLTFTTAASAASHVAGSPYAVTPAGLTSPDYTIKFVPGRLTVLPAPLTVTVEDTTEVTATGRPVPPFPVSYGGLVNGDTPASLGGTLSFALAAAGNTSGGGLSYVVTPSGLTSGDYVITYRPGTVIASARRAFAAFPLATFVTGIPAASASPANPVAVPPAVPALVSALLGGGGGAAAEIAIPAGDAAPSQRQLSLPPPAPAVSAAAGSSRDDEEDDDGYAERDRLFAALGLHDLYREQDLFGELIGEPGEPEEELFRLAELSEEADPAAAATITWFVLTVVACEITLVRAEAAR